MKPIKFKEQNIILTKPELMSDDQCGPLPIYTDGEICVSRWKMTLGERLKAVFTGKLWLLVWSGRTQPPVFVGAHSPFEKEQKTAGGYQPTGDSDNINAEPPKEE